MLSLLELGKIYNEETERRTMHRIRNNILMPLFSNSLSNQQRNIKPLDIIMGIDQTLNCITFHDSGDICNLKELSEKVR